MKNVKWTFFFMEVLFKRTHQLWIWFVHVCVLLPPFHRSSPDHSAYRDNTKPTAVQQYTHSQPTDSKLLLSFPTTPCLRSQPPAKQTVLEISLQITLCLPNPPGSRGNQNPGSPCPHRKRPQPHSHRNHVDCIFVYSPDNFVFYFKKTKKLIQHTFILNFKVLILICEFDLASKVESRNYKNYCELFTANLIWIKVSGGEE